MDAWLAPGACAAQLLVMCALQQGRPLWAWRGGAPANSTGIRKCGRCVARGKSTMAAKMCELTAPHKPTQKKPTRDAKQ